MHALIIHMPPDNVFFRALAGDGWSESDVEHPLEEDDIRPRTKPPAVVVAESKREQSSVDSKALHAQERSELMALVTGDQSKN